MPSHLLSPSELRGDIALCVGGSKDCLAEYHTAKAMCAAYGKKIETFVCNDTIPEFPDNIDHAVTLHPDKFPDWIAKRAARGGNFAERRWCHKPSRGFTDYTSDWTGSSGLLMVKIARELGYTHVILCGVPMSVDQDHIVRKKQWQAAHGFRRGWISRLAMLRPYVRSMSGWTLEQLGYPSAEWIKSTIEDKHRQNNVNMSVRA